MDAGTGMGLRGPGWDATEWLDTDVIKIVGSHVDDVEQR